MDEISHQPAEFGTVSVHKLGLKKPRKEAHFMRPFDDPHTIKHLIKPHIVPIC